MKRTLLLITGVLSAVSLFAVNRTWIGAGAGGVSSDFNLSTNWLPIGDPTGDDLTITMIAGGTIDITSDITVASINMSVGVGAGISYGRLDVGGNTLTVSGAATFDAGFINVLNYDVCELDAGSGGGFVFQGTTIFENGGGGDIHLEANIASPGKIQLEGDATFNAYTYTTPADEPYFVFDANGSQTITFNTTYSYIMGEDVIFGLNNTPNIQFAGTATNRFNIYEDDLTIKANCVLDIEDGTLDIFQLLGSSTFTMEANSELRIGSTRSMPSNNGLFGNNGFGTYDLDPTSKVIYDGTNQTVKDGITYGHLEFKGSNTKTSGGDFSVIGNLVNDVTFDDGNDTHTFSGTTDQTISGTTSPTTFYNLVVNKSGTLTSSINLTADNELQIDAGTFLVDGETVTCNNVIDINGGTLQITSGTITQDEDSSTDFDQDGGTFDIDGGIVNVGVSASQSLTDYNLDGGTLDVSGGTLNIVDEFDMNGGTFTQSGGTINVKSHTGANDGTAVSKFDVSAGTVTITNGDIHLQGAYDNTSTYPAMNLNPTSSTITGGTIYITETGSNDENFYIQTNGNAINNLTVNKSAAPVGTITVWQEDFEDRSIGDEADGDATAWTTACTGGGTCGKGDGDSNDFFEVKGGSQMSGTYCYEGSDMDGEAKWSSEQIDITGQTNVAVSVDLEEDGFDNGSDYILVYYELNNSGTETLLTNGNQSGNFNTATATVSGLNGNTSIEIHVYMNNTAGNDDGKFDDVTVTADGTPAPGVVYLSDNIDINGDLLLTNEGGLDVTASNRQVNLSGNWTNTSTVADAFIEHNGTVVFDGGGPQQLTNVGGETFHNVTMSKSANQLTINDDVNISNGLDLTSGVIITGTDKVSVTTNSSGAITSQNNTSFIYGNLRRAITSNTDTYPFPIGNGSATTNYYRADVANNNMTTTTYIDASVGAITEAGNNTNANLSTSQNGTDLEDIANEAEWSLIPDAQPGSGSYGVRLYTANIAGIADNDFTPVKRDDLSTDYADWSAFEGTTTIPAPGTAGRTLASGYAQRLGYTGFSKHAIAIGSGPLPIELVSFSAHLNEDKVELNWQTATEINNDYFTIERSADGKSFETILKMEGAGNSNSIIEYFDIDYEPIVGISYYRLKQTDFDGKYSYSNIVPVRYLKESEAVAGNDTYVSIFPNPSNGQDLNIKMMGFEGEEEVLVLVRDISGKEHYSKVMITEISGNTVSAIDLNKQLSNGVYLVTASSKDKLYSKKLIVK